MVLLQQPQETDPPPLEILILPWSSAYLAFSPTKCPPCFPSSCPSSPISFLRPMLGHLPAPAVLLLFPAQVLLLAQAQHKWACLVFNHVFKDPFRNHVSSCLLSGPCCAAVSRRASQDGEGERGQEKVSPVGGRVLLSLNPGGEGGAAGHGGKAHTSFKA